MAYLDEDILYNNIEEKYKSAKGKAREAYSDVLDTICEMPRAYVAPKSDVASEIIDIIELRMEQNTKRLQGVCGVLGQGIYIGREEAYRDIKEIIEQKYTEEKK